MMYNVSVSSRPNTYTILKAPTFIAADFSEIFPTKLYSSENYQKSKIHPKKIIKKASIG